tara:strand:- start:101 stop:1225 length:1125 start_codon:yes stop_codon:yes gene_type:complete
MSELNASNFKKEHGNEGPDLVGVTEFSSPHYFVPPSGTTEQRPQNPQPGTLRFNTDFGSLEFFRGDLIGWERVERVQLSTGGDARAVMGGGFVSPGNSNKIDYGSISTRGKFDDFGVLTRGDRHTYSGVSSKTRGCWGGGFPQATQTTIDYITIPTTGDAIDFGDMSAGRIGATGLSNQTRGCWAGGYSYSPGPRTTRDVIDYITIASTGAAKDFGNLQNAKEFSSQSSCASTTRGIYFRCTGNIIDYITITTQGNALDFGDVGTTTGAGAGLSNSTRGIIAGGGTPGTAKDIYYITIATKGNAVDFGDLDYGNEGGTAASSPTRGLVMGMKTPSVSTQIDSIEIMSTGNAVDFGNTTEARSNAGSCSNAHGGL